MKRLLLVILCGMTLSGCATHWANVKPEWNPPSGQAEAEAKCEAQAKYAWNKFGAYASCMAAYGYEKKPGRDETK